MTDLLHDFRFALRNLRRSPGFTAVACLTLALGIGANSAIFSVLYGVVLKPLPYPEPGEVTLLSSAFPSLGFDQFWVSPPEYLELRERLETFESLGAYVGSAANVSGGGEPFRASTGYASHQLFEVLGVPAALGRTFGAAEDAPGGESVVVLSDELWRRAFAADRDVLGRKLTIDDEPATVVGVMPPGFDVHDEKFEMWMPLGLDPADPGGWGSHYLTLVGRLRDGATLHTARAEIDALYQRWDEERGEDHHPAPDNHPLNLEPLQDDMIGPVKNALWTLFAAVGFVLLIACANVANLLLVRAETRRTEIAVRSSLGAGRWRLLRQFLAEGVMLGLLGAALGLALAAVGLRVLLAVHPESVPRTGEIALSAPVVGFTIAVAVVTGLLFGLAPVLQLSARNLAMTLKEGGSRTASARRHLLRRGLVSLEMALAVVLVVGSALMLQSFWAVLAVDAGFEPDELTTFRVALTQTAYPEDAEAAAFVGRLTARLRELPGVEAAAAMNGLPPQRDVNANDTEFEGLQHTEGGPPANTDYWQFASHDYFTTMGIPIVAGRGFTAGDDAEGTPVVVINETTAETYWPGESALGRRVRPGWGDVAWRTVVGVAKDVKQGGLDQPAGTELYFPVEQTPTQMPFMPRSYYFVVRSSLPLETLGPTLRGVVRDLDPALPVADLQTMNEVVYGTTARPRFLALLLGIFAAVALALAAVGTYGVMAYQVAERRREIGVRMALGAPRGRVLGLVLAQGMTLAAIGLAVGVAASLALSRFLQGLLYGVAPTDTATYLLVPLILAVVALLACLVPAVRAARVAPSVALRYE